MRGPTTKEVAGDGDAGADYGGGALLYLKLKVKIMERMSDQKMCDEGTVEICIDCRTKLRLHRVQEPMFGFSRFFIRIFSRECLIEHIMLPLEREGFEL